MASSIEIIEAEALRLSATERAQLIERLIASLDVDPGVEDAWAAEVERRNNEIETGKVSLISGSGKASTSATLLRIPMLSRQPTLSPGTENSTTSPTFGKDLQQAA